MQQTVIIYMGTLASNEHYHSCHKYVDRQLSIWTINIRYNLYMDTNKHVLGFLMISELAYMNFIELRNILDSIPIKSLRCTLH